MLINYGDFVQGGFNTADPYIQLYAVTNDTAEAHKDFVSVRLNGVDNGKSPLSPGNIQPATTPSSSRKLSRRTIYIIVACACGGAVALLILGALCCRRRSAKTRPMRYVPLGAPAPVADPNLRQAYGDNSGYAFAPQYQPQGPYRTPWDGRQ
jgi:hypothetical protein